MKSWDMKILGLAEYIAAAWSKDPSTKVGAVITRPDHTIVSVGYNGFPRGIRDTTERLNDREMKLNLTVHAEMNAILNAREPLKGYTLYVWPPSYFSPTCHRCAPHVIQTGIINIVGIRASAGDRFADKWAKSNSLARTMYREAGVEVYMYD